MVNRGWALNGLLALKSTFWEGGGGGGRSFEAGRLFEVRRLIE